MSIMTTGVRGRQVCDAVKGDDGAQVLVDHFWPPR